MIIKLVFMYLAQLIKVALPLIFIPLIINIVGMQEYALVSFLMLLLSLLGVLEAGIYGGIVRVISTSKESYFSHKDALLLWNKAFSYVVVVCTFIVFAFACYADVISLRWIKSNLEHNYIRNCLLIIGLITALTFVKGYLISKFVAYEKHIQLSAFQTFFIILQYSIAYFCLLEVANTVEMYFYVLALCALTEVLLLLAFGMYFSFKQNLILRSRNDTNLLAQNHQPKTSIKDFIVASFSLSSLTIFWTISSQADKVILSGTVDSITFSYYQIASQAALSVNFLIMPLNQYLLPRLSTLFAVGEKELLNRTWFSCFFYFSAFVALFTPLYFYFGDVVINLWLDSKEVSNNVHSFLKWLFLAAIFQSISNFLFVYYYAVNKLKKQFFAYFIFCLAVLPCIYFAIVMFGPEACSLTIMFSSMVFLFVWGFISFKFYIDYFRSELLFLVVFLCILSNLFINLIMLVFHDFDSLIQFFIIITFYSLFILLALKRKQYIHRFLRF